MFGLWIVEEGKGAGKSHNDSPAKDMIHQPRTRNGALQNVKTEAPKTKEGPIGREGLSNETAQKSSEENTTPHSPKDSTCASSNSGSGAPSAT